MESAILAESALASVVVVLLQAVINAAIAMIVSNFFIFNYLTGKVVDIQNKQKQVLNYFFLKKIRTGTPVNGKLSRNLFSR